MYILVMLACHACLNAILNSKYNDMTYHCEGKDHTLLWRAKSDPPKVVSDLFLPKILQNALDVICSLLDEVNQYDELRQVLLSTIPVFADADALERIQLLLDDPQCLKQNRCLLQHLGKQQYRQYCMI